MVRSPKPICHPSAFANNSNYALHNKKCNGIEKKIRQNKKQSFPPSPKLLVTDARYHTQPFEEGAQGPPPALGFVALPLGERGGKSFKMQVFP